MNILPPDSFFRCMPIALPLKVRRLFGALAYAVDGAEMSYDRLHRTATGYHIPANGQPSLRTWLPESRLSAIVDAWAVIDHIVRLRKLLPRFDYEGEQPAEVQTFLSGTEPARQIRNRLHHLDEDIFNGVFCEEGHPAVGTVSWVDTREPPLQRRYSIASGPHIDAGTSMQTIMGHCDPDKVSNFKLMASDQTVSIDDLMRELRIFVPAFEARARSSATSSINAAIEEQGAPLEQLIANPVTDMTLVATFKPTGPDSWEMGSDGLFGLVEVPPGAYCHPLES